MVSELRGVVGALACEYGGRPGAQAFLSGPAWPLVPEPPPEEALPQGGGSGGLGPSASATAGASGILLAPEPAAAQQQQPQQQQQLQLQAPSRLQHAVASAVVLLPADCREAFTDVMLGALVAGCFQQQPPPPGVGGGPEDGETAAGAAAGPGEGGGGGGGEEGLLSEP